MGRGGQKIPQSREDTEYSWEEVKKHQTKEDKWIVIDGQVLDITRWAAKHPGGSRVISHYAGQDATEAFTAFHNDRDLVRKYMKPIVKGRISKGTKTNEVELQKDFEQLRILANKMGLFRPSVTFFLLAIGHIILLEVLAYCTLWYYGDGWLPWLFALACYVTVQAQAGWTQHDFGHLSVFSNTKLNHLLHQFSMGLTKGAAADWWNHLHYQHHAKPNVIDQDPDVRLEKVFVIGENMPKIVAKQKKKTMPYNWQQYYFFLLGPTLTFPVYFQFMLFKHTITRKKWVDLMWTLGFYVKFFFLYSPLLGTFGAIKFYFLMRTLESHWFMWVAQSNHIPMEIAEDKSRSWVSLQLAATCDIEKSAFNDWFTGHLNFQIEHHLFPTMPRHNLYKVMPLVKSLCAKHNVPYVTKQLGTAFVDIIRSLKHSGELWEHYTHAYDMVH
jgi:fatty acid desaturase 2 (delta-6 desaturase)